MYKQMRRRRQWKQEKETIDVDSFDICNDIRGQSVALNQDSGCLAS